MVSRTPLKENSKILLNNLKGESIQYTINGLIQGTGDKGGSCLCYIAEKHVGALVEYVILKEFYPSETKSNVSITRLEDGSLNITKEDFLFHKTKKRFEIGTKYLMRYVVRPEFKDFLCCREDIELLFGNGTCYCENLYYPDAFSWKNMPKDIKMDQIFLTAIGTHEFLVYLHKDGKAYVDLKPDDILITHNTATRETEYKKPLFYDFNSTLEIGKLYPLEDIYATDPYAADAFRGSKPETLVDIYTENETFAKVIENRIAHKKSTVSKEINDEIDALLSDLKRKENAISEKEAHERMETIREHIQSEECAFEEELLKKKRKKFTLFHWGSSLLTILICIFMTGVLAYWSINSQLLDVDKAPLSLSGAVILAVSLLILTLLMTGLKILTSNFAIQIANVSTSCKYFHTPLRNGDYNTFNKGGRKNTTYQDTNKSNTERQQLRHVLWVVLGVSLVAELIISIKMNAFPLFLELGFPTVLAFMFADFLPSNHRFYKHYAETFGEFDELDESADTGRALYYMMEYDENPEDPFNVDSEFYVRNHLNQDKIRDDVLNNCIGKSNVRLISTLKKPFHYKERLKAVFENELADMDLHFEPLQIQQIYKMAFDRLKNFQVILSIVSAIVTLTAVFMNFMVYTGYLKSYFGLHDVVALPASLLMVVVASFISIFQVIYSGQEELIVAEMAYKSKYIQAQYLNHELIKDIAAGFVTSLDIARGTYQYSGYVNTERNHRMRDEMLSRNTIFTIPLFQHKEIANRNRLAITVWLIFGTLFAWLVWQNMYYWLAPILLIIATTVHIILYKRLLPVLGKKKVIKDIKRIEEQLND